MSSYKRQVLTTDLQSAIADAFSELQCLRDEMREWADNMESGGLGHTDKCQQVSDAADALDNVADNEPLDIPNDVGDLPVFTNILVQRRKGREESRAVRCQNAGELLSSCVSVLDAEIENLNEQVKDLRSAAEDHTVDAESNNLGDHLDDEDSREDSLVMATDCAALADEREMQSARYEELRDELIEVYDEIEYIEFPGMFG